MTDQPTPRDVTPDSRGGADLRRWEKPLLQRMSAGSAEIGANAIAPEGAFASGDPPES